MGVSLLFQELGGGGYVGADGAGQAVLEKYELISGLYYTDVIGHVGYGLWMNYIDDPIYILRANPLLFFFVF